MLKVTELVRQRENFLVLMNNYSTALDLEQKQLDSAGSAMVRYGEFAKGTEAKINDLTNALQKLYTSLINSNQINIAIESFTKFINVIRRIIENLGGLNTILLLVSSVGLIKLLSSLFSIAKGAGLIETAIIALQLGIEGLSASLLTLLANPITWLVVAVGVITVGIFAWANAQQKLKEQTEATNKSQTEFNVAIKEFQDTLDPAKLNAAATALENLKNAANFTEASKKVDEYNEKLKNIQNNASLSNTNKASQKRMLDIQYKEYLNYVQKVKDANNILYTEKQKLLKQDIVNQKVASIEKFMEDKKFFNEVLSGNETLKNQLASVYGSDFKNFENFAQLKEKADTLLRNALGDGWSKFYKTQADALQALVEAPQKLMNAQFLSKQGSSLPIAFTPELKKNKAVAEQTSKAAKVILDSYLKASDVAAKKVSTQFSPSKNTKKSGSGSTFASSSMSEALIEKDRYAKLNMEIERTNGLLEQNRALQENTEGEKKIALLKEEAELLKQKQSRLKAINDERRKERDELSNKNSILSRAGIKFSGSGDSLNAINAQEMLNKKLDQVNAHRNDKNKTVYNNLKKQYEDLSKALTRFIEIQTKDLPSTGVEWQRLQKEINSTKDSIIDKNTKIADKIIDTMKDAYEKQSDLAVAAIDKELDALNDAHDKKLELLDEELDRYNDIIDAKMKSIEKEADIEDYNANLAKAQKERQDTVNKINILSMDDSFESVAAVRELNKQLLEQDEEIAKMKSDRERELRKENLEDQLSNFKDEIDAKRKTENDSFKIKKDGLEKEKKETEEYYNELIKNEQYWAELRTQIINGQVENVKLKLNEFLNDFKGKNKETVRSLGQSWQELLNIIDKVEKSTGSLSDITKPSSGTTHEYGMSDGDYNNFIENGKAWNNTTDPGARSALQWANDQLRKKYGIPDGAYPSYHTGNIVGGVGDKITELMNKLFNNKPNEQTAKLLKGELVTTSQNIKSNFLPNLQSLLSSMTPAMAGAGGMINNYNLNLNIENLSGDKKGADLVYNRIISGIKKIGGKV